MNSKRKLYIGNTCLCGINISLRNIIEIGVKPTIEAITTDIAASLYNTQLFGNYLVNYLFVTGNIFDLPNNSAIGKTYTLLLIDAINKSIESKGKDTVGIALEESFFQSLRTECEAPFMCDSFYAGNLKQVSRHTYGIQIKSFKLAGITLPFLRQQDSNGRDRTISESNDDGILVIIQKGEPIPIGGLEINLTLEHNYIPDSSLVRTSLASRSNTIELGKIHSIPERECI